MAPRKPAPSSASIDPSTIVIPETEISDIAAVRYSEFLVASNERQIPDVRDGLKPVQRRILLTFKDLNMKAGGSHRKSAKIVGDCFAAGTLVSTIEGLRAIEEIEVGDFVRGPDGSAVRVSATYVNPPKSMVRVHFANGQHLDATPDQLFRVVTDELEIVWRPAKALSDFSVLTLGHGVDLDWRVSDGLARTAYTLGLFVAEGFPVDRRPKLSDRVRIHMVDPESLNLVETWAADNDIPCRRSMRLSTHEGWQNQHILTLSGRADLFEAVRPLSAAKIIPASVLIHREAWAPFLAGFLDGDGHVGHTDRQRRIQFATTSPHLAHGIQSILSGIGVRSRLYHMIRRKDWAEPLSIEVNGADASRLAAFLVPFVQIKRKAEALSNILNPAPRQGIQGNDLAPMRVVWEALTRAHRGGGWFADVVDGTKFRLAFDGPGQAEIRFGRNTATGSLLVDRSFPISRALTDGWDIKLDRIGSPVGERLRHLRGMCILKVMQVEHLTGPAINYDIQVESDDHSFVVEGIVVHNCMANLHPHGDSGIYDAAVVMAQDWHFRYPLVDGSGNFGSIDGSGSGASRYTEMRPAPMGDEMVRDLYDRAANTVPWTRNYLNDRDEPLCLASRFPNLLVNGILLGIGTGHSASWLPHNLGEVIDAVIAVIDDPTIAARDLIRWMKGPDFPTGCTIIGTEGYLEALETGRGRVVARAKMAVEEDGRDQAIVITEIPWKEDKASIIEQIMIAGRPDKSGSAARIPGILDCEDQSGRDWRTETRIVVSMRRDANPKLVGALLYKHTALETSYTYHQNAYQNVYPALFNTREVIDAYIAFQMAVLTRRTQYRRQIALDALEVQNAYLFAYKYENKLVPLARASKNKAELETKIPSIVAEAITERQCRIIAEMPLYRFSQIDTEAVKGKIADLTIEIAEYDRLLATTAAMAELLKVELREIKTKYGDPRRTVMAGAKVEDLKSIDEMIPDEACYLVLASSGLVARHSATTFRAAKRGQTGVATAKSDEDPIIQVIGARTKDRVWLLTNQGNVFAVRANELEEVSRGARGTNVRRFLSLSEGEQVAYLIVPPAKDTAGDLYIATTGGKILRCSLADYGNINAGGLKAIKLRPGDAVASAFIATPGEVILVTSDGFSARFDVTAAGVPIQGRGSQGVDAIKVNPGARVISADAISSGDKRDLAIVLSNGRGKKTSLSEYPVKGRSIRGITAIGMPAAPKSIRVAFAGVLAEADQAIITTTAGRAIVLPATEMKRQGRATAGVITVGLSSAKGSSEAVANGAVVLGG